MTQKDRGAPPAGCHRHRPLVQLRLPLHSRHHRVLSPPPYLLVDNIGRNVELWRFQPGDPEPTARTIYVRTSYSDDPIASLLDVDLHAAFVHGDGHELLTVNHYGRVRRFDLRAAAVHMEPTGELQLLGDTERVVMANDCLVASSPRGEFTDDASHPGIFLFERLPASWDGPTGHGPRRLVSNQALADWGVISALAVRPHADRLAVAAGFRLGVFKLLRNKGGLRLGQCMWETAVSFHCQWLQFDETERLWAGGHRRSAGDTTDWEACRGGGLSAFRDESGVPYLTVALPDETAWGSGADPLVLSSDREGVYVLGPDASLHVVDLNSGAVRQLYAALDAPTVGGGPVTRYRPRGRAWRLALCRFHPRWLPPAALRRRQIRRREARLIVRRTGTNRDRRVLRKFGIALRILAQVEHSASVGRNNTEMRARVAEPGSRAIGHGRMVSSACST